MSKQNLKNLFHLVTLSLVLILNLSFNNLVLAQGTNTSTVEYKGVEQTIRDFLCAPSESADPYALTNCINRLYRFGIAAGALVLVFFVVLAGYFYITGGEQAKAKGKTILQNSMVGVALLLGSYILLRFLNPNITMYKSIQPPIFSATIPSCEEVFGTDCTKFVSGEDSDGNAPVTPGNEKDGVVYGGSTFNNFPRWYQGAQPWGSQRYGNASNCSVYKDGGCGPSAFAAIVKYYVDHNGASISPVIRATYGADINPSSIGRLAADKGYRVCPGGSSGQLAAGLAKEFGLVAKSAGWSEIQSNLERGIPAWISVGGPGPFTTKGHLLALIAKKGDTIYISDSSNRNITAAKAGIVQRHFKYGTIITSNSFTPPKP